MLLVVLTMVGAVAEQPKAPSIAAIAATAEYRPLVAEYAQCIVARDRAGASDFALRKNIEWTKTGEWTVRRLLDKSCRPAQATKEQAETLGKMTPDMLRPSIADALVRVESPAFDQGLVTNAQPLPAGGLVDSLWPPDACKKCDAEQRKEFDEARAKTSASMTPYIFAECAVRADPGNAHRLLMADVNSASETSAFAALAPAFGQCVAEDAKINSSRTVLRGLIALSYYRLAHAPRVTTASAGATK